MRDSRAGFAWTDPGVPGAGAGALAAAHGPARGQGQPDPSAPGRLAVTPARGQAHR